MATSARVSEVFPFETSGFWVVVLVPLLEVTVRGVSTTGVWFTGLPVLPLAGLATVLLLLEPLTTDPDAGAVPTQLLPVVSGVVGTPQAVVLLPAVEVTGAAVVVCGVPVVMTAGEEFW